MTAHDWGDLLLWVSIILALLAAIIASTYPRGLGPIRSEGAPVFGWLALATFAASFLLIT